MKSAASFLLSFIILAFLPSYTFAKPKILWHNQSTGQVTEWFMNGTSKTSEASIVSIGSPWKIDGTGDYNSGGKPDIFCRNYTTCENRIWYMNRVIRTGTSHIDSVADINCRIVD
jgi:hypothetical protein